MNRSRKVVSFDGSSSDLAQISEPEGFNLFRSMAKFLGFFQKENSVRPDQYLIDIDVIKDQLRDELREEVKSAYREELKRELREELSSELSGEVNQSFANSFHSTTGDSWRVLMRNAKDGETNSVLAATVLRKTTVFLHESDERVRVMLNSSSEIVKVVDLLAEVSDTIRSLSDRCMFVSLNASIEAERAGENGRTFGVVAAEVGVLSVKIRDLTQNIGVALKQIDQKTVTNGKLCTEVATNFKAIHTELTQFNKIMMRIEELAQSQVRSFDKYATSMNQVARKVFTK